MKHFNEVFGKVFTTSSHSLTKEHKTDPGRGHDATRRVAVEIAARQGVKTQKSIKRHIADDCK